MIGDYLTKHYEEVDINGDGKISYILFKGEEGNNEAIYRTQYSVREADKLLSARGKTKKHCQSENQCQKFFHDKFIPFNRYFVS